MTTNIPESNQKVFAVSFIIAILAIVGFILFVKFNASQMTAGVDKEVLVETPDPMKVFDAPFTKATLYYIDLPEYPNAPVATNSPLNIANPAFGCGDRLLKYNITLDENQGGTKSDAVNYVLTQLFSRDVFEQFKLATSSEIDAGGDPYNALAKAKLKIKSVKEVPGQYEVRLTGTLGLSGACDVPRVQAQLEHTINQIFAPATAAIFLNDKPLAQALSGKK